MTGPSHFAWFLRRDLHTNAPKQVVCWRGWMGGFEEHATWPWDEQGLADAGRWLYENRAVNHDSGFRLSGPDALMVHAGAS